jgi:phosphoribosyl-ATP pyrophosphohydrolase
MKRKGKLFPFLLWNSADLIYLPLPLLPHSTIQTEIIVEKLANVHSQGRRSRVLDVGAVSLF